MPLFKKKDNVKEIAIIGLGRFGGSLARRLETLGHRVLGIDSDPIIVKELADEITGAVVLDAMDEDALRQVDITAFHTVVVAVSSNFETSVLLTSTLKNWGIPQVISKSNSNRHREILLRIGADRVVLPEEESGYQLADELSIPGMLEVLRLSPDYSLIEIKAPAGLIGKGIEAGEPYGVTVVLILRGDDLIINPDPDVRFLPEDILVLVGEKRRLAEFSNIE
ncbi:MAG TPA: TrkA family potassium uptake protein [Anaerolineales bacterium]|nr:TrkA family potassium uptake protein [Anaerolineales bacterium]